MSWRKTHNKNSTNLTKPHPQREELLWPSRMNSLIMWQMTFYWTPEVIDTNVLFLIIFYLSSTHSTCSQQQWGYMTRATMKVPSFCLRRRWWSTTKQMWSVGLCAKGRRGSRAIITSATATVCMNSYQVRAWTRARLLKMENIDPTFISK